MPYNIAAANSGGYNYASGRLDHQTYFRAVSIEQARLGSMVLDPIFTAWAQDESLSGGYSPQSAARLRNATPRYMWRGHGHVDPKKEADAQAVRLANRTTTFQDEYAREGLDWRREFDKIAEAQAYADSLGISLYPGVEIEEAEDEDE